MKTTKECLKIIKSQAGNSKPVYVVGGWLRDKLLGRVNRDLDVALAKDPLKLAKAFAKSSGGSFVLLDANNKIYRVVLKENSELAYVDFAKMKADSINADLMKRDFTINSFAAEIQAGGTIDLKDVIDLAKGKTDLKQRVVRLTYDGAFKDDPLRILRAFRIASELNFTIAPATLKAISLCRHSILSSASERVREELVKILSLDNASEWITMIEKSGILETLIPEITPMKKSARKFYFHPNGLWQHSEETLKGLENIFLNLQKYFPNTAADIAKHLQAPLSSGMNRKIILKLTALLHDCAKPLCAKKFGAKMRFLGHENKGAVILGKIFERLKIGRKETIIAKNITANHMRPVSLSQAGTVTGRASFRLFRDMGENTPDLLLLALADWHSYKYLNSNKPKNLKVQEAVLKELLSRYFTHTVKQKMPKLVDGNILMKELKLKPGPIIGALLKAVTEAQMLGKINTKNEAISLSSKKLTQLAKKYRIKIY